MHTQIWLWLVIIGILLILLAAIFHLAFKENTGWVWWIFVGGAVLAVLGIILAIVFTYPLSIQLASIFQRESPFEVIIGIPAIMMIVIPPLFLLSLGSIIGLYAVYKNNLYEQVQTRYIG